MGMLDDWIAVVTGGRSGVGRAVCERFEAEGAIVYAGDLSDGGSAVATRPPAPFSPSTSPTSLPSWPASPIYATPTADSTSS